VLNVEVSLFEDRHAEAQLDLVRSAFSIVPEGARPKESVDTLRHMHGEANPAGRAWMAFARFDGRLVGSVAAVPYRFRRRDGVGVTGWQIGTFAVDASAQRQGVGRALLDGITADLERLPESFVYTYPNQRSIAVFDRHGYQRLGSVPTRIHPPWPGSASGWALRRIETREVPAELAQVAPADPPPPGFVRDASYFRWRFCGPSAEERYRFVACRGPSGREGFVVALASHRFLGLRFGVLADACPDVLDRHYGIALRAAGAEARRAGAWLLYVNSNVRRLGGGRARPARVPWSVPVPDSRNPRPIELLYHPRGAAVGPEELAGSLAMTADWGGF
jgi:predicted N-acetyltransferase YhbS